MNLKKHFKKSMDSSFDNRQSSGLTSNFIGYTCTYIPEEILISGGLTAYRIKGSSSRNISDGFMPINFCPYIKSIWAQIYNDNIKSHPVVFTAACDAMRRLNDIVENFSSQTPLFLLDVPKKPDEISVNYFSSRIENLLDFVQDNSPADAITAEMLKKACDKVSKKRALLRKLTKIYESFGSIEMNTSDYFKILDLSAQSDVDIFNSELEIFLKNDVILNKINTKKEPPLKLLLIGNYINDENFWNIFSDINAKIVSSDLCLTSRYFDFDTGCRGMLEKSLKKLCVLLADSYLKKPACFRMQGASDKIQKIKQQIADYDINGVIFASVKFCDNTLFFYPDLKKELLLLNIPSLYADIEYGSSSSGQLKTRIEAFIEMFS